MRRKELCGWCHREIPHGQMFCSDICSHEYRHNDYSCGVCSALKKEREANDNWDYTPVAEYVANEIHRNRTTCVDPPSGHGKDCPDCVELALELFATFEIKPRPGFIPDPAALCRDLLGPFPAVSATLETMMEGVAA